MKALIRYIILNPIVVKLVILFAFIFGLVGLQNMNSNFFTPIEPNFMRISVVYPGASALEVEDGILIKIENNLKRIPGIEQVNSTARENMANVLIEFQKGADPDDVVENVKNAVNQINNFPKGAEKPIIYKEPSTDPAATLSVVGNLPLIELKDLALMIQQDLTNIDGISLVKLVGLPEEELQIKVSQKTLQAFDLTLADVGQAILNQNIDLTAGSVESATQTFLVRNRQKESTVEKIRSIVIRASDQHSVRLADIADIKSGWSENGELNFYNNQRSISLQVDKTIDEDLLGMIKSINTYINQYNERQDASQLVLTADRSNILKQRIGLLTKNGIIGFCLIVLCLTIFLSFRLSFWVAFSIPISFLGLFFVGSLIGITINVISLFGMIVVIGILVDDGIIIAENIYQHVERGATPLEAAVNGVKEVTPSIVAAITTTIIAFSPFFFLDGLSSKIMSDIAVVVIITLLVSIIEGLFILPAHLVQSKGLSVSKPNFLKQKVEKGIRYVKDTVFINLVTWSLKHRLVVFGISIGLFVGTFLALKLGLIKTTFFPYIDADQTKIELTMPPGTRQSETLKVLNNIEPAIYIINDQFKNQRSDGKDIVLSVSKTVKKSGDKGVLSIELLDGETRQTESSEITKALREQIGVVPEADSINFGVRGFFGKPVVVALKGNDLIALEEVKQIIKEKLNEFSKIKDVVDQSAKGSPEVLIEFVDNISMMDLTPASIMSQIRHGFYGLDIQDVQRGINEVAIRAEFVAEEKESMSRLDQLLIKTSKGDYIPLGSIATYKTINGTQQITRINGVRQVNLEANLTNAKDPVPQILTEIKTSIVEPVLKNYPTLSYEFLGQSKEQEKMRKSMPKVMNITMIIMFATIAAGFGSFYQAFLVLLIIPFGFIGVAWGHKLHGMPLSIMSTYGIIALIGIIVNDSIVLVNTYNRFLAKGLSLKEAVIQASVTRFRPIMLTSITTIVGLGPLILEKSRQAQFLIPMAIAICYGLLIATFFILVLLPIFIVSFNQFRYVIKTKLFRQSCTPESIEPTIQKMEYHNELS